MATETYLIPAERLSLVQAGVEKLNRRAKKLGFEPVVLVASEPRSITRMKSVWVEPAEGRPGGLHEYPVTVWVRDVRFEGQAPRINGFAFQAALTHTDAGNLVRRGPGVETDLVGWREASARCQHCGLDRNRAETFLLQAPTGELVQIGRNCLVDYIGTTDVAAAVQLWRAFQDLVGEITDDDGEYGFGGGWCPTTPREFLAFTVASTKYRGFRKAAGGEDGVRSTRDHVRWLMGPAPRLGYDEWIACRPTEEQFARADEIMAWVAASTDASDYMHNARIGCAARSMLPRTDGLLASLPVSYDKHLGALEERKARPAPGPHVGAVGDKIEAKVVVRFVTRIEADSHSPMGGTDIKILVVMTDERNSKYKTFSTSGDLFRLDNEGKLKEGEWYMYGTVKRHESDKRDNAPVTVLTRVVLRRDPAPAKKPGKPRKACPSKGKPMFSWELPGYSASERASGQKVAFEWKCPEGVHFNWSARAEGLALERRNERLERMVSGGFEF